MKNLEDELTDALLDIYQRAGEEAGYWGKRFLQSVRRNGGLATAKRMINARNKDQQGGFVAIVEAGKPELTVESIMLEPRFRVLFTDNEISEAHGRPAKYSKAVEVHGTTRERLFPNELESGIKYFEGARKQVRVNAYERDPRARKVCLNRYGYNC